MSREAKLAKNTVILSIGTFMPKLATFITLPVLTAYLSKEQYGTYDLITILVSLLLPITTLLIQAASFRFLIEHKNDKNYAKLYFTNSFSFVVPVSVFSLSILYVFLPIDDSQVKIWICIYLLFDALVNNLRQIARGMARNLDYSISATISSAIKIAAAILLVQFLKYELLGAIIALALSSMISFIFLFIRIRAFELFDITLVNKDTIKEMLAYSWPMIPNNMSAWIMRVSDRLVISIFMGISANAVYAVANKIPNLLSIAQSTFSMAWQENASIASNDKDVSNYYSRMFIVMNKFYAGCLGLIIASTPILFKILIKGDYAEAYPQMPLLFLATFFHCMSSFLGGIYIAFKRTKSVGVTTVVSALINISFNFAFIKLIGLYAASISTLLSYLVLFIYRMIDVRKLTDIRYDFLKTIAPLIVIFIESAVCFLNNPVLNILNVCFGVITFLVFNKEIFIMSMNRMRRKIHKEQKI